MGSELKPGMAYWRAIEPFWDEVSIHDGPKTFLKAVCLTAWKTRRLIHMARNALVCLGGLFVAASATPLPPWFYFILLVAIERV